LPLAAVQFFAISSPFGRFVDLEQQESGML
jgi:hypothetical protein